jgi:hypothetical protein
MILLLYAFEALSIVNLIIIERSTTTTLNKRTQNVLHQILMGAL